MLTAVGGSAVSVPNLEAAQAELERMPAYASAKLISSLVPGLGRLDLDPNAVADPHELEKVDFAIVPGVFAVAENAAVWLSAAGLRHRALWFLAQHLAIVLPAHELVHNLHEAYARLTFEAPGFGAFVSGPSKTADIEQSLVIGAHGARSCVVFLVGDARA
jgi:L-lactate dehydrogenase complex protein LldG